MRLVRSILIGWLAIAIPATTTASIVSAGHCQRMQENLLAAGMDHAQHNTHTQHSADTMTMAQMGHQTQPADNGCSCGCNCTNQHCTLNFSSLMGALHISSDLFAGTVQQIARMQPGHLAPGHHLDLLRPPTLN
jgi:hypothetical protein